MSENVLILLIVSLTCILLCLIYTSGKSCQISVSGESLLIVDCVLDSNTVEALSRLKLESLCAP